MGDGSSVHGRRYGKLRNSPLTRCPAKSSVPTRQASTANYSAGMAAGYLHALQAGEQKFRSPKVGRARPRQGRVASGGVDLQAAKPFFRFLPLLLLPCFPVPDSTASTPARPSLADFACLYLYGLTNQPNLQPTDLKRFGELYHLVIGNHGGLGIAGSFHPYQLVNSGGISVWYAAFAQFYAQPNRFELFAEMTLEKVQFGLVSSSA